jgi:replicative DNA helicase
LGVAEIIIAKHRNGATGDIHLSFKKELAKFSDLEHQFAGSLDGPAKTYSSKMNDDAETTGVGMSHNSNFDKQRSGKSDSPF